MVPNLGRPSLFSNAKQQIRDETDKSSSNLKAVGLRILVHGSPGKGQQPKIVVKQSIKVNTISIASLPIKKTKNPACIFLNLNSCHLCSKNLTSNDDIFMYRGDQGYCSIDCRSKQIEIDEKKDLEASTRQMLASFRHCHNDEPMSETRLLLEDLRRRRRHNRLPSPRIRAVVS